MKLKKLLLLLAVIGAFGTLLTGCKDYCSYGGCMSEATSGGRCSAHQGLDNDPYYGIPDEWY